MLLLTGAPDATRLQWTEHDLTVPLLPAFQQVSLFPQQRQLDCSDQEPNWRSVPLQRQHLPSGFTQPSRDLDRSRLLGHGDPRLDADGEEESASCLSVNRSSAGGIEVISQYYEHSFALHQHTPPSQVLVASAHDSVVSTSSTDASASAARPRPISGPLTDLKDLPTVPYLQSINPQTMTVNLIVGIISVGEPRQIRSRRGGHALELIELLVGDETDAGFAINIWLPSVPSVPAPAPAPPSLLRKAVRALRPRDILLVRNLALASFRGVVYGQSLRRDVTKLDLLYRHPLVDRSDRRGVYRASDLASPSSTDPWIVKTGLVHRWTVDCVYVPDAGYHGRGGRKERIQNILPPDAQ